MARSPRLSRAFILLALWLAPAGSLWAARVTDIASSFDQGIISGSLRVGYNRMLRRGLLQREFEGATRSGALTTSGIVLEKQLRFTEVRHTLDLRADFSLLKALQVYIALPIILQDTRNYDFAQNNAETLTRDGFLDAAAMGPNQVAVAGPNPPPGGLLLPNRAGVDQLYIGLVGAPISQQRDPSKPTWVIGVEGRIGVGASMEYFRDRPTANTSVGRGVHEIMWWMAVSRRFRYLDPWMSFYYILPVPKQGSLYDKTSFPLSGQERSGPQQRGGGDVGLEIIPWEQPAQHRRLTLELSARIEGVFEGRGYSDVWELFANLGRLNGPCRPDANSINPNNWRNGTYCSTPDDIIPFPGITNIENYAVYGGNFAVDVELTRFVRARLGMSLAYESPHYITFGDPGRAGGELNTTSPNADCRAVGPNQVCLSDERQVNPMYRVLLDGTGHRFHVDETTVFDFFVSLQGQF